MAPGSWARAGTVRRLRNSAVTIGRRITSGSVRVTRYTPDPTSALPIGGGHTAALAAATPIARAPSLLVVVAPNPPRQRLAIGQVRVVLDVQIALPGAHSPCGGDKDRLLFILALRQPPIHR